MGCAQSRIENEESVMRCKLRRQHMGEAVIARNAFAAAHSQYTMALKNTGAALSDFGQGESLHQPDHQSQIPAVASSSVASTSVVMPPMESLPPPPPPLPEFSPSPLKRASSMPAIPKKVYEHSKAPADPTIAEDDGKEIEEVEEIKPQPEPQPQPRREERRENKASVESTPELPPPPPPDSAWDYFFSNYEGMQGGSLHGEEIQEPVTPQKGVVDEPLPPPPPEPETPPMMTPPMGMTPPMITPEGLPPRPEKKKIKQGMMNVHHQHAASASAVETRKGKMVERNGAMEKRTVSLSQVLTELDDHFLRASESAHEVSKMLEANRMHYHSNFADNRGHIDHSARVMQVITWNRSFKGMHNPDDLKDDFDNDECETHATVLDKMLAWEKKLYEEVKAGELMKFEYQRKAALLNKQKKRNASLESIEKTKAAVSHLHTRYIVDMQSMDSTVHEIERLRDDQLYPKLMELVDGMAMMWETMYSHHDSQLKIVNDIRTVDLSYTIRETSEHHYDRTVQLYTSVQDWENHFQRLINHQEEYIKALSSWLKLNLIPIESNLKEKVSSPPRVVRPPIQGLLLSWHEHMEKLPNALAKSAIHSFSEVVNSIVILQKDELKQKLKCEDARKEYVRKSRAFDDWYHKYSQKRAASGGDTEVENAEGGNEKDLVEERKLVVDTSKTKMDDEIEIHQNLCRQVREKSLGSLKSHLPELFRAMSDFSLASSEMYKNLGSISRAQNAESD